MSECRDLSSSGGLRDVHITSRQRYCVKTQRVFFECFVSRFTYKSFGQVYMSQDIFRKPKLGSEGIDEIPRYRLAQMRLQRLAIDHIDGLVEE